MSSSFYDFADWRIGIFHLEHGIPRADHEYFIKKIIHIKINTCHFENPYAAPSADREPSTAKKTAKAAVVASALAMGGNVLAQENQPIHVDAEGDNVEMVGDHTQSSNTAKIEEWMTNGIPVEHASIEGDEINIEKSVEEASETGREAKEIIIKNFEGVADQAEALLPEGADPKPIEKLREYISTLDKFFDSFIDNFKSLGEIANDMQEGSQSPERSSSQGGQLEARGSSGVITPESLAKKFEIEMPQILDFDIESPEVTQQDGEVFEQGEDSNSSIEESGERGSLEQALSDVGQAETHIESGNLEKAQELLQDSVNVLRDYLGDENNLVIMKIQGDIDTGSATSLSLAADILQTLLNRNLHQESPNPAGSTPDQINV